MKSFYDRYWDTEPEELSDYAYKWPVISRLIPHDSLTILDYGCGKGKILSDIRRLNAQADLYGADISDTAREVARIRVPGAKILPIGDDQRVLLPEHSCDFLLSLDVIEHVYDTERLFTEFRRLVKTNGHLLLSTPYYGVVKNIVIALIGFETVYHPKSPHIRFYTKRSLLRLLDDFGFKVEQFGFFGRFYPVWRGMYALARKV